MTKKTKFVPMLFSTSMVKAIDIDKTKTETRRIIKHKTEIEEIKSVTRCLENQGDWNKFILTDINGEDFLIEPKVNINDIIWVRETFTNSVEYPFIFYKADADDVNIKWKPSLFMPKDACRIFLKCVSVHAERLQDIDEQSAIKEGAVHGRFLGLGQIGGSVREGYFELWERINGKGSVAKNPFVWVYKFERIEKPSNFI